MHATIYTNRGGGTHTQKSEFLIQQNSFIFFLFENVKELH